MANTDLFAVKDAIDLKISKKGESTALFTINYLNSCQIQMDATQVTR